MSKLPIMVIGSNPRNLELLSQFLGKEGYETRVAKTQEQFVEILDSEGFFELYSRDISTKWCTCITHNTC